MSATARAAARRSGSSLVYLYGVVPAAAPEPDAQVRGIEGASVRLVRNGSLAAIVSDAPADVYEEQRLNERLSDVEWVGERGLAHERVLTWFVDRAPVVPLTLFSLHRDDARVAERLAEHAASLERALQRVTGRREWGIKIWRDDARARARLEQRSEPLRALGNEMAAAREGTRYLLARKRDALEREELRRASADAGSQALETLRAVADDGASLPLPPGAAGTGGRTLVLHAAFLVSQDALAPFQETVRSLAARQAADGFEWEFTGPWPAYHFSSL
jgi:hypothetical protein